MRSSLAVPLVTVAAAASIVSAQDCNPSYNVAPSTTCFTNCNINAGQKWVSGWTMDHTSPNFLKSLALMCDKSGSNYSAFMAAAGMCMASCAGDDPELFNKEWSGACAWWATHKNDACATETKSTTTTTTQAVTTTASSSTAIETTSTVTTTTTTTTTSVSTVDNTTSVSSGVSSIATIVNTGIPVASANISASTNNSVVASITSAAPSSPTGASNSSQAASGANKVQLSSYALVIAAGLVYFAF